LTYIYNESLKTNISQSAIKKLNLMYLFESLVHTINFEIIFDHKNLI